MNKLLTAGLTSMILLTACQTTEMTTTQSNVEATQLDITLLGSWNGTNVPAGQQCPLYGGDGSTPPMRVDRVPDGTSEIIVQYNDRSFPPLSRNGGHGVVAYPATGNTTTLAAVPGMTADLGAGARIVTRARSTGQFASRGYLPPCSGGRGNIYEAVITAVSADNTPLATRTIRIGRY